MAEKIPLQWKNGRPIPVMDTQLADFPGEEWKVVPDFEGYQVSNFGRVKSLGRNVARYTLSSKGIGRFIEAFRQEKIMKLYTQKINKNSKHTLIVVVIMNEGKVYRFSVARLVYHVFISPIDLKDRSEVIKRKDNDSLNCHSENLYLEHLSKLSPEKQVEFDRKKQKLQSARNNSNTVLFNTDLTDLPGERWKYISGFDKKYRISNYGRVKSVARLVTGSNGQTYFFKERIHKLSIFPSNAAENFFNIQVNLIKDGRSHIFTVPRLVYHLFVAKFNMDDRSLFTTRKDNNPLNCHYKNLELKTVSEIRTEGYEVNKYNSDGIFIQRYSSIAQAAIAENISVKTIYAAITNKNLQGEKNYWQFGDPLPFIDVLKIKEKKEKYMASCRKPVQRLAMDGQAIEIYESLNAATRAMGAPQNAIKRACNNPLSSCMDYRWRFVDKVVFWLNSFYASM